MGRHVVTQVMVQRIDGGVSRLAPDQVIVEEPMEIRLDGHMVTTTMRTPGHDFELAVGFCHSEGLLAGAPVRDIRYCAAGSAFDTEFNVVSVGTGGRAPRPVPRLTTTSSSCGMCGSEAIDELRARIDPLVDPVRPSFDAVRTAIDGARHQQPLFDRTGAVHAAAAFDVVTGRVDVVREDIGRHNAADKVIGRLLLDGRLPARRLGLVLSGRVSLEMVQKAWAAGIATVVSVGGPSSLAVQAATTANMTLVAFARGDRMNVYVGDVL